MPQVRQEIGPLHNEIVKAGIIQQLAHECGFDLAGVAPALPVQPDADRYLEWVAAGMAGKMGYLTDHRAAMRTDPRLLLPPARSIVCVGKLYAGEPGPVSRYAQSDDYHDVLRSSLQTLAARMEAQLGAFDYKICVDTAPLLERSYARLAGLGWIGKNTCLINETAGSWLFLGEMLTSLDLEPSTPAPYRCGTCTRCIDACPTGALSEHLLDARTCISYLTIELKGAIPEEQRSLAGSHVFGCDICQAVCPWNDQPGAEFSPDELERWASLNAQEFRLEFRHTPVWRTRYSGFLRNVAVAMGNTGDARYVPILRRLEESSDPVVASHAGWAAKRLEAEHSRLELEQSEPLGAI